MRHSWALRLGSHYIFKGCLQRRKLKFEDGDWNKLGHAFSSTLQGSNLTSHSSTFAFTSPSPWDECSTLRGSCGGDRGYSNVSFWKTNKPETPCTLFKDVDDGSVGVV